jgi:AraC-like DNA-binding protein
MNAARTGRKPAGPQIAERLEGSPVAKQRLEVILKTIAGQLTVTQACQQLGIGESRFHALRNQTLQTTLESLEPRPLGRPAKPTSPEQAEVNALQEEIRRLHAELELAQVQLTLAHIHPALIGIQPAADDPAGKKNARSARQQRQQRRAQRRRRKPR